MKGPPIHEEEADEISVDEAINNLTDWLTNTNPEIPLELIPSLWAIVQHHKRKAHHKMIKLWCAEHGDPEDDQDGTLGSRNHPRAAARISLDLCPVCGVLMNKLMILR